MNVCPDCGSKIPEDAPLGLCPACLVGTTEDEDITAPSDSTDEMIAGYRIIRQVGEGGFAIVYEAEQTEPVRRRVALKVLKTDASSPQVLARFDAEGQALALMDHPHIASIYDAGQTPDGNPYFAMEFVDGGAITEFANQRNLTVSQRLDVLRCICEAVQHAHLKGILHRDIKPSNIVVTEVDGRPHPKVIDFGIARALDVSLTNQVLFTELHQIVGTPSYMSPEQAALDKAPLDGRSDIYSLGILIYETLTGVQAFSNTTEESASVPVLLRRVCEEAPPPLSRFSPELRGDIQWVVSKAIAKKPEDRYDSAGALARELERILDNHPVQAAAPSNWYCLQKFVQRHRAPVIAGTLAVLAVIVGIIVGTIQYLQTSRLSAQLQVREVELRHEFRNSDYQLGLQFAARRKPGDAIAHFCRALRTDPDHHASASCLLAILANQKFTKAIYPAMNYPDSVRACRQPVIFDNHHHVISLIDEADGEALAKWTPEIGDFERIATGFESPVRFVVPLGLETRFAIASENIVEIRSAKTPGEKIFRFELNSPITSLVPSRTSPHLAGGTQDGQVALWNIQTGTITKSRELSDTAITSLAMAQDGTLVGYGTASGEVGSWIVNVDKLNKKSASHQSPITALDLPESGSHLVTGDESGMVYLWRTRRMAKVAGPIYHGDEVRILKFNSAFRNFMSGSADGYARMWDTQDGSLLPPTQFHQGPVTFGILSPNSKDFFTGSAKGSLRIWSATDGTGEAFPGGAQATSIAAGLNRRCLVATSDRRRQLILHEIDREPVWLRRLNPGDGTDHRKYFGSILPDQLETKQGDFKISLGNGNSLFRKINGEEILITKSIQPIVSWDLRPDGRQVATLSEGGRLQIWDPRSGEPLTPLIRLSGAPISGIRFPTEDGQLEVLLDDGELARFEIPPPEPVLPPWFLSFAESMGGKHLNEEGQLRHLGQDTLQDIASRHSSLEMENPIAQSYLHWFLTKRDDRTPGPSQEITTQNYVNVLLGTNDPKFIREALRLDPGNHRGVQLLKKYAGPRGPMSR